MRIESSGPLANLSRAVQRQSSPAGPEAVREGLRVSLSDLARGMSAKASSNQDIDDSDLPESIKQLLKMIRELKAQIADKRAEVEALMAAQGLSPEAKRLKLEALQTELATLSGALASANANLLKLMHENNLSSGQMQSAASLAMG
ncbi:MAG TPA: hypothetical protein VFY62_11150 [Pseudomonas sp.]|nr:hypothetical protein [Pseudomonas sp.]